MSKPTREEELLRDLFGISVEQGRAEKEAHRIAAAKAAEKKAWEKYFPPSK